MGNPPKGREGAYANGVLLPLPSGPLPHSLAVMKRRPSVYLVLLLIFLGSARITAAVPAYGALQVIAAVPALGVLFAALFQVFRDQAAFERQLLLQQQPDGSLGVAPQIMVSGC